MCCCLSLPFSKCLKKSKTMSLASPPPFPLFACKIVISRQIVSARAKNCLFFFRAHPPPCLPELSWSVDNLCVFLLLFDDFKVGTKEQNTVFSFLTLLQPTQYFLNLTHSLIHYYHTGAQLWDMGRCRHACFVYWRRFFFLKINPSLERGIFSRVSESFYLAEREREFKEEREGDRLSKR